MNLSDGAWQVVALLGVGRGICAHVGLCGHQVWSWGARNLRTARSARTETKPGATLHVELIQPKEQVLEGQGEGEEIWSGNRKRVQ